MDKFDLTETWTEVFYGEANSVILQASEPVELWFGDEPEDYGILLRGDADGTALYCSAVTGPTIHARAWRGRQGVSLVVGSW